MALKQRSEIVRALANDIGNSGDSIMRWSSIPIIGGAVVTALGYQYNENLVLWGGGTTLGVGVGMFILGWMAAGWGNSRRGTADKIDELNLN